jgi:hypothetical protein
MRHILTIYLTSVPLRELIAPQAQGWFCDCRRNTDDDHCGQSRLTFSLIFSEFRLGFSVSSCGPLGRFLAPNKQDLKSEKNTVLFSEAASFGCLSVLFGWGRAVTGRILCVSTSMSGLWRARQQSFHNTFEKNSRRSGARGGLGIVEEAPFRGGRL